MEFSSPTLIFDPARAPLPQPIASRMETLARGVLTTPDELADLIEATFDHLFRLRVAEFARAGAPDAGVARYVVQKFPTAKSLGARVALSLATRAVFIAQRLPTAVRDLAAVDFGSVADETHPVPSLLAFRNGFAHGNFSARGRRGVTPGPRRTARLRSARRW